MNQKSIELLSSEELENVTGGANAILDGVKDFFVGFADSFYSCYVDSSNGGQFNKGKKVESIGRATSSAVLTASLATTVVYGTYKLTGVLRSKLGEKEVEEETEKSTIQSV